MHYDWSAFAPTPERDTTPPPPWAALPVGEPTQCYACWRAVPRAAGGQPSLCDEHSLLARQLGAHERGERVPDA